MRFTIIVAGCNTAPYLPKALASIEAQTFGNFEAILYVEESTDESLEICRSFAEKDPRFTVATGPRSGAVAATRNYGIDHAKGEYLVVLDGDDWLMPDMLEKLNKRLHDDGPLDVLAFSAITVPDEASDLANARRITNFRPSDQEGVFTGDHAIRLSGRNSRQIQNFTWLNAYNVEFLRANHIYQSDGVLMEDIESTPKIWLAARRMAYLDEPLYVYRRRPGSLTKEASPRVALDTARQIRSLTTFAASHIIPDDIMRIWANQWMGILFWFLFHPNSSSKVPDNVRRRALWLLLENKGKDDFIHLSKHGSLSRRIAIPLVFMAAKDVQWPAKFYFRALYYPILIKLRGL